MTYFPTFWGGGFDSIAPLVLTPSGLARIDLVAATQHDRFAALDYSLLHALGLGWTREDVRWHLCEPEPGCYTFEHLEPVLAAARQHGITVIWSWMHYGCPTFYSPLDPDFPARFAALGEAHARWLLQHSVEQIYIAPVNEISYYTWRACRRDHAWYPFGVGRDYVLKQQLIAAHKQGYQALKALDATAKVLQIDPFYYATGNPNDADSMREARGWCNAAMEAFDALVEYTDILGVNFYPDGQVQCVWDERHQCFQRWMLPHADPRRIDCVQMLRLMQARYPGKPFIIAETSQRAGRLLPWLRHMTAEAIQAINEGIPLLGMCWYPVLDVIDWGKLKPGIGTLKGLPLSHSGLISMRRSAGALRRYRLPAISEATLAAEDAIQSAILAAKQFG